MPPTLTITQVAKAACVTRATIYRWISLGRIPVEPVEASDPPRYPTDKICGWLQIDEVKLSTLLAAE